MKLCVSPFPDTQNIIQHAVFHNRVYSVFSFQRWWERRPSPAWRCWFLRTSPATRPTASDSPRATSTCGGSSTTEACWCCCPSCSDSTRWAGGRVCTPCLLLNIFIVGRNAQSWYPFSSYYSATYQNEKCMQPQNAEMNGASTTITYDSVQPPFERSCSPMLCYYFSYFSTLYFLRYSTFKILFFTVKVNGMTAEPRPPIL